MTEQPETSYSLLAWELAQYAKLSPYKMRLRASITLHTTGERVSGFGRTSNEALRNLASALTAYER